MEGEDEAEDVVTTETLNSDTDEEPQQQQQQQQQEQEQQEQQEQEQEDWQRQQGAQEAVGENHQEVAVLLARAPPPAPPSASTGPTLPAARADNQVRAGELDSIQSPYRTTTLA